MTNINELFNAVQLVSAIAIIAFSIFYILYRKEIHKHK